MVQEAYVTFDTAKLLKEKGFNEKTAASYNRNGELQEGFGRWNTTPIYYAATTLQMAIKWLREIHKILILVEYDCPVFSSDIYKMDDIDEYGSAKHVPPTFANCKNYEDAIEIAIKYCLKHLI